MPSTIALWGHSLGVRLPRYIVERTGVQRGDLAFVSLNTAGDIVIRAVKPRAVHAAYRVDDDPTKEVEEVPDKW